MRDTIESLTGAYRAWCAAEGLPDVSADEQDPAGLTAAQQTWLDDFLARWEAAELQKA